MVEDNEMYNEQDDLIPVSPGIVRYYIDCIIDPASCLFTAEQKIYFQNNTTSPVFSLVLDLPSYVLSNISISVEDTVIFSAHGRKGFSGCIPPLHLRLPSPITIGEECIVKICYQAGLHNLEDKNMLLLRGWYPRLGRAYPPHADYSVKITVPGDFEIYTSGVPDREDGFFHVKDASSFGILLTRKQEKAEKEVSGVRITALFPPEKAKSFTEILGCAAGAVNFYKSFFSFFPYPSITIFHGRKSYGGGFIPAPGLISVHEQNPFRADYSDYLCFIAAHETARHYWGEYILGGGNPDWANLGIGMYMDEKYLISEYGSSPVHREFERHYYEAGEKNEILVPPHAYAKINGMRYNYNNFAVHAKAFVIIKNLADYAGVNSFEKIIKKIASRYKGRRLTLPSLFGIFREEGVCSVSGLLDEWSYADNTSQKKIKTPEEEIYALCWHNSGVKAVRRLFKKAESQGMKNPFLWLKTGILLYAEGAVKDAEYALKKADTGNDDAETPRFISLCLRGIISQDAGHIKKALKLFRKALDNCPNRNISIGRLGLVLNKEWVMKKIAKCG